MSVKCAIFKYDHDNPIPNYKDLDVNLGKTGKVLYGGEKRKSKTTPYIDRLHLVDSAFSEFNKILFPRIAEARTFVYCELYLFDKDANETMLYLKYPSQIITHFVIDDSLIDNLHHLSWSHGHLQRYLQSLKGNKDSLNFFIEKEISDKKFEKSFPQFIKSTDKLMTEVINASKRLSDNAELIFKSGW